MTTFALYLSLGFHHISDTGAYDHILFLVALCAVHSLKEWRRILVLVTGFTLGHTLTLALATLNIIPVPISVIEFLIPVTIFITALWNTLQKKSRVSAIRFKYGAASFFGLIHGMGFSTYLRSLLGKEESLLVPLFSFNLGIELGQITIVIIFLLISFILVDVFGVRRHDWNLLLSGAAMGVALILALERIPW